MPLATLDQVKAKLEIPTSDLSEDAAVQDVLDAAEQYVLDQTGYVLTTQSVEDIVRPGQIGRVLHLRKRPVSNVTAQVRMFGSDTWTDIAIDVIDANEGIVVLPGEAAWPPGMNNPRWFAWREPAWDVLRISYTATALSPVPDDLSDATAALAAYWYRAHLAGVVTEAGVGQVRETYSQLPVLAAVDAVLARHRRETVTWW